LLRLARPEFKLVQWYRPLKGLMIFFSLQPPLRPEPASMLEGSGDRRRAFCSVTHQTPLARSVGPPRDFFLPPFCTTVSSNPRRLSFAPDLKDVPSTSGGLFSFVRPPRAWDRPVNCQPPCHSVGQAQPATSFPTGQPISDKKTVYCNEMPAATSALSLHGPAESPLFFFSRWRQKLQAKRRQGPTYMPFSAVKQVMLGDGTSPPPPAHFSLSPPLWGQEEGSPRRSSSGQRGACPFEAFGIERTNAQGAKTKSFTLPRG